MKWEPIETAPRDGTVILTCYLDLGTYYPEASYYGAYRGAVRPRCWRTCRAGVKISPSYWMPLPEPPPSKEVTWVE